MLKSRIDDGLIAHTWEVLGTFEGGGDQAAIRAAVKGEEDPSGTYVAVPERSWRTRALTVTTVRKSSWA